MYLYSRLGRITLTAQANVLVLGQVELLAQFTRRDRVHFENVAHCRIDLAPLVVNCSTFDFLVALFTGHFEGLVFFRLLDEHFAQLVVFDVCHATELS